LVNFLYLFDDLLCPPGMRLPRLKKKSTVPRRQIKHRCKHTGANSEIVASVKSHTGASDKRGDPMAKMLKPLPPPTIMQVAAELERDKKLNKALNNLGIIQTSLEQHATAWRKAARKVGGAYKTADNHYRETLKQKEASDARQIQIWWSILTIGLTGALGWIGAAAIASAESKAANELRTLHGFNWTEPKKLDTIFLDVRDVTLQAVAGEASSVGPYLTPPTAEELCSRDPQNFQNDLEDKIDDLLGDVLQDLNAIRNSYNNDMPSSAWDTYDPRTDEAALRKWQKKASEFAGDHDLPDEAWMARELERGRWAQYVLDHQNDDVGDDVRGALQRLKVSAGSPPLKTEKHFSQGDQIALDVEDKEAGKRQLLNWAKNFKVRDFLQQKRLKEIGGDHQ
jgi:hypothetical protein